MFFFFQQATPNHCSDNVTLVVSVIAVIVSAVSIVITFFQNRNTQKISLEASYFREIFEAFLRERIPSAFSEISLKERKIQGTDNLANIMCEIRKDASYFLYSDPKFYEKLKKSVQDIENACVNALNFSYTEETFKKRKDELSKKIVKLYRMINKRYYGK